MLNAAANGQMTQHDGAQLIAGLCNVLSLTALGILIIGNRMRVFDSCERGWVLVQRRRQPCSQGQGQKGKESEDKKASFVFSNRAFPVGKKTSFNSACPSGDCRNKVSSISRPFCVFSAPGSSGLLVKPGARLESTLRDDRSFSASGSMVSGAFANSCVISAWNQKHDAGGDAEVFCPGVSRALLDSLLDSGDCEAAVVLQPSGASARVSRAPGDSPADSVGIVRPLCVDSAGVSRAPCDSPADFDGAGRGQPLCVASGDARRCAALRWSGSGAHATASENKGIIGLLEVSESDFPSLQNSSHSPTLRLGSSSSACARVSRAACAGASACVCPVGSSSAEFAAIAHAHASILHGARNSWSDTVRVQGPTGTKRVKGGFSGPAEDLRPVSEVEAGINFRPAGGVRGQVAGSIPGKQPGTGTRRVRESAVTPRRFLVSNSCHLDTDWTSGNRWAGRRCVEPHCRGFGC